MVNKWPFYIISSSQQSYLRTSGPFTPNSFLRQSYSKDSQALYQSTGRLPYKKFHAWKIVAWTFHAWKCIEMMFPSMTMAWSFRHRNVVGSWAVHNLMHGNFTHEHFWAKFSFSCMNITFSCMEIPFHA